MSQHEEKKKKFNKLLEALSDCRKESFKKKLSEHDFSVEDLKKKANLFDEIILVAILEQAEGLSLTFDKPHSYQIENTEFIRLTREAYDALNRAAILKAVNLGPMTFMG